MKPTNPRQTRGSPGYPKPAQKLIVPTVHPRPLRPINRPRPINLPDVDLSKWTQPVPFFGSEYTRTTHVVSAAMPRNLAYDYKQSDVDVAGESKEARKSRLAALSQELLARKRAQELGERPTPEVDLPSGLVNVLDRYVSNKRKGRVTLFVAHANGFPRRIWEPVLHRILAAQDQNRLHFDEIWSFEAANHGDGAVLNGEKLGDTFEWADNSRDMLNFLINFIPSTIEDAAPPVILPPVSAEEATQRRQTGFRSRTLVGLGHSIGACTMIRAAEEVPELFKCLALVDPVVYPFPDPSEGVLRLHGGAISRRMRWASREEARANFLQSPFFSAWHPEELEAYIQAGICDDPENGGVRLKQSGFQEASSFAERLLPMETCELLETLPEQIAMHWIMAGLRPTVTGLQDVAAQTVWRRETNSTNVRVKDVGHLIVHEAPDAVAFETLQFVGRVLSTLPQSKL